MTLEDALDQFFADRGLSWLGVSGQQCARWLALNVEERSWERMSAKAHVAQLLARAEKYKTARAFGPSHYLPFDRRRQEVEAALASEFGARNQWCRSFTQRGAADFLAMRTGLSAGYIRNILRTLAAEGSKYYDANTRKWRHPSQDARVA